MKALLARFLADESGVTAVEYGVISASLIGVSSIGMHAIGERVSDMFVFVASFFDRF